MRKNIGKADKVIRIILAAIIATLFFTNTVGGVIGLVLLVLAVVFVLTSFAGTCPLYLPFKISTNKEKK